jgi:hypothetical protein
LYALCRAGLPLLDACRFHLPKKNPRQFLAGGSDGR